MIGQPQTCRVAPGDEGSPVVLRGNPAEIIEALKGVYDEPLVTVLFYRKVSRLAGHRYGRNELHCLLWTMLQEQVNHSTIPVSDRQQELDFLWGSLHDMIASISADQPQQKPALTGWRVAWANFFNMLGSIAVTEERR